ncbi:MAG TPA: ligase-associated DNA damage response DEXH box helicase [Steroidobacteraceae bacterium]|nr:ligase-associated DNA damage response DEXH box helicase [Steroidobacteraceae bacterium]
MPRASGPAPIPDFPRFAEEGARAAASPSALAAIERWFDSRDWQLASFQRETMKAYLAGESGLVHAPTGSGKTLAAWLGPMAEAIDRGTAAGLQVLWITPLRALANDVHRNLTLATDALGVPWQIGLRTGDTSSSLRKKQRERPPHALVTTPESLSVMLSFEDSHESLRGVRAVIVDEWHELMGSKRGVQLELCLAHLRAMNPQLRTWGLSATLGNLDEALTVLLGSSSNGRMIHGPPPREVSIESVEPPTIERFPWAGHLGTRLLVPVLEAIERADTTLLFTNTRSQAEIWYRAIAEARLDWFDRLAIHHGSISMQLRRRIEAAVQARQLKCVVCTSSLDLGVDFAPVDQVIQIGSPKGVARLLQRAGRSGHQPGGKSRIVCVPTHAFEPIEFAAARRAQAARKMESRKPLRRSLDVLVQHAMTLAAGPGFNAEDLLNEARKTHAFAELSDREWQWTLDFLTRGGDALQGYPQYRRVDVVDDRYRVNDSRIARLHRMQIGTITSDAEISIKWMNGSRLGSVEEVLIARLKPGDTFVFAGRVLELVRVRDMAAYVKLASSRSGKIAKWQGGRMPLSNELAESVQELLELAARGRFEERELQRVQPLLELQQRWSQLPTPDMLLVEHTRSREGFHVYLYPFAGRTVNEGIATLMAHRWAQLQPITFAITANDYGAELLTSRPIEPTPELMRSLLRRENLGADLLASLNFSEVARRQFREIARIAGLVFQGYPGARKLERQLQASSGLIFDVLRQYDPENLLLDQARREVFELHLEETRLAQALEQLETRSLNLVRTTSLTPLSFPIWAERLRSQILSTESFQERIQRMIERLEKKALR